MKFKFRDIQPPPDSTLGSKHGLKHGLTNQIGLKEWTDWQWQMRSSLKSETDFNRWFGLNQDEKAAFSKSEGVFHIRSTPYYTSLITHGDQDPIRKILAPSIQELDRRGQHQFDPLGERKNNPVPRIIHRYPDRVLFLVTDFCSVYCRYCTRKHFTGNEEHFLAETDFAQALKYIQSRPGIREVILSGGDPLTLSDEKLEIVLKAIRAIEHIEIIRIGTRMPVVNPMRVTQKLAETLRRYKPVFLMTHFNHPKEITVQSAQAIETFVDHGIPVMNQMVLLNGVNNHAAIVQALNRRLLYLRAKPYYMFQCDPSEGTDHLRTTIDQSQQIQKELWGNLSGLAMANLSLDIPSGGGKVGLVPNFQISEDERGRTYKGWDGVTEKYEDPKFEMKTPIDASEYFKEWEELKSSKVDALSAHKLIPSDQQVDIEL